VFDVFAVRFVPATTILAPSVSMLTLLLYFECPVGPMPRKRVFPNVFARIQVDSDHFTARRYWGILGYEKRVLPARATIRLCASFKL